MVSNVHPSPGVYTKITDIGTYLEANPSTVGFIPIISEKGPDNRIVQINSTEEFYQTFGEPEIGYVPGYSQGPYVASEFLRNTNSLYVIRCLPLSAAKYATFANISMYYDGTTISDATSDTGMVIEYENKGTTVVDSIYANLIDSTDTSGNIMTFYGIGRGAYYNDIKLNLYKHQVTAKQNEGYYTLDVYVKQTNEEGRINTFNSDTSATSTDFFIRVESFDVHFDPDKISGANESVWIEEIVNNYSKYIRVQSNEDVFRSLRSDNTFDYSTAFTSGLRQLANGADALTQSDTYGTPDATEITSILGKAYNGTLVSSEYGLTLSEVKNIDGPNFTVVFDAGYPSDVKDKIKELVDYRQDCVAICDNGHNYSVSDATTSRDTHNYDTPFVALYESYTRIRDNFTNKMIWITPVYHMASVIPYSDRVSEVWFAPAGEKRATLTGIRDIRFNPNQTERDTLYLDQLNPIVRFDDGDRVWGQLTTYQYPSPLQDLAVVRLYTYVSRVLRSFCMRQVFDPNDTRLYQRIKNGANLLLKEIQERRGLYSYELDVGSTDYERRMKTVHVNVTLEPVRAAERIELNFFVK